MERIKRYTWSDLLVKAHAAGLIDNGALLVCMKLSAGINWEPKDGRMPGLYWKNDSAFELYGIGRRTYYKHKDALFELGFLAYDSRQNVIPALPNDSLLETINDSHKKRDAMIKAKCTVGTDVVHTMHSDSAQDALEECTGGNPLSEEYSVKTLSEEYSVPVVANAPTAGTEIEELTSNVYKTNLSYELTSLPINVFAGMTSSSLSSSSSAFFEEDIPIVHSVHSDRYRAAYAHDLRHGKTDIPSYEEYASRKERGESVEPRKKYNW